MRDVYLQRWARSTVEHYEFDNVGFADIEGYEYYGALANNIDKHGLEQFNGFLADLQVWGTPDQVTEKLLDYVERTDAGGLVVPAVVRRHAGRARRTRSFDLFASEVLPELQAHDVGGDIGVTYGATAPGALTGAVNRTTGNGRAGDRTPLRDVRQFCGQFALCVARMGRSTLRCVIRCASRDAPGQGDGRFEA